MNKKTVELIGYRLRIYGFRNLKEYYGSELWKNKRDEFRRSNPDICCAACGKVSIKNDVHHKSYKSLCDESLDQLCYLCRRCHRKVHDLQKKLGCSVRIATKKIQRKLRYIKRTRYSGRNKISQIRSMDSSCLKGIARTSFAHRAVDDNIYDPPPVTIISPNGKRTIVIQERRERPKPVQKKLHIEPRIGTMSRKRRKVKLKYTEEELKAIIYKKSRL